ncbi:MAG: T9SS type A sorting domain-containing protein [Sphingobacteriales bacterium]|nr:MAG: T9SS type A sorting domain-containing protein [Sphingobacteriales bacterium]
MKRLSSLLLLLLLAIGVKAQLQLDDFYKQGTSWCEVERLGTGHGVYVYGGNSFFINSDTSINGIVYHKLNYNDTTIGGIRVATDTVFFLRTRNIDISGWTYTPDFIAKHPLGIESILYKFDLNVGDSLDWKNEAKVVSGVDTVVLSNGQRVKKYLFANGYNEWVWGIGGNKGLFGGRFSFGFPTQAKYYNSHWVAYNFAVNEEADCFPNSVAGIDQQQPAFSIYPNPLTDNALHINSIGVKQLSVVDIAGRVVYTASNIPAGEQQVHLNIAAGMYLLKAQLADGSMETKKLMIER